MAAGWSICGRQAGWAGKLGITSPAVQASCSRSVRALAVTPPGCLRGRGQCWSERQSSMSHGQSSRERPLGQLPQPFPGPGCFFNSLFSRQSLVPDRSSSLFSTYRLQRIWLFPKFPSDNNNMGSSRQHREGDGAVKGCGVGRRWSQNEEVWQLPGNAKRTFSGFQVHWDVVADWKCHMCSSRKWFHAPKLSENLNLPCNVRTYLLNTLKIRWCKEKLLNASAPLPYVLSINMGSKPIGFPLPNIFF